MFSRDVSAHPEPGFPLVMWLLGPGKSTVKQLLRMLSVRLGKPAHRTGTTFPILNHFIMIILITIDINMFYKLLFISTFVYLVICFTNPLPQSVKRPCWLSLHTLPSFKQVWETYSWSWLLEILCETTVLKCQHSNVHSVYSISSHHSRVNVIVITSWLTFWDALYCGAEATADGWFVWIPWVVKHSLIRGFFHRRGGRLGNPALCSRSQAERLCRWHGTRILWLNLQVLKGRD